MPGISWICPYCNQAVTLNEKHDIFITDHFFRKSQPQTELDNSEIKGGAYFLQTVIYNCPNINCHEITIYVYLYPGKYIEYKHKMAPDTEKLLKSWTLQPSSKAKIFPSYIPNAILTDYQEACEIVELSPKASATLSRRCLQSIIRDYWKVTGKKSLYQEIEAIKDKVDPLTWDSINAVRSIGNIGAHMEKDINLIIDVDKKEASLLIQLIEDLLSDWYIARHEREQRCTQIIQAANAKKDQKNGAADSKPSGQ